MSGGYPLYFGGGRGGGGGGLGALSTISQTVDAVRLEDIGTAADVNILNADRFYDTTIDMPATANIADTDMFMFSLQYRDGTPPHPTVWVSGKDWKGMTALTTTEQASTSINATRANKVVTFFLRRTSGTGGQSQQNPYFAKGADGVSLYVGDNNNPFDANMRVWRILTVSETTVTGVTGGSPVSVTKATHKTVQAGTTLEMNPLANNGDVTNTHGLSRVPDYIGFFGECLTADQGWAVGDIAVVAETSRVMVGASLTNTYISVAAANNNWRIVSKNGSSVANVTPARWKLIAIPYLFVDTEVVTEVTGLGNDLPARPANAATEMTYQLQVPITGNPVWVAVP